MKKAIDELKRLRSILSGITGLEDDDQEYIEDARKSVDRIIEELAKQPAQQTYCCQSCGETISTYPADYEAMENVDLECSSCGSKHLNTGCPAPDLAKQAIEKLKGLGLKWDFDAADFVAKQQQGRPCQNEEFQWLSPKTRTITVKSGVNLETTWDFERKNCDVVISLAEQPAQQEPDWLDKEQAETDWDHVWLLIKAASYASSRGFISGTTNWGSAVSRYMRNESPQPAQPQQEPVAWLDPWTRNNVTTDYDAYGKHGIPLYTSPPEQRKPLTDEEIFELAREHQDWDRNLIRVRSFARAIEAAHEIKEQP